MNPPFDDVRLACVQVMCEVCPRCGEQLGGKRHNICTSCDARWLTSGTVDVPVISWTTGINAR